MGLDQFGFPAVAIANALLIAQEKYEDSTKELEDAWLTWLGYYPFDAPVAARLSSLMQERLARTDQEKDGARRQVLARKLGIATLRAERYRPQNFGQDQPDPSPPGI